jgi:hypothetical protein
MNRLDSDRGGENVGAAHEPDGRAGGSNAGEPPLRGLGVVEVGSVDEDEGTAILGDRRAGVQRIGPPPAAAPTNEGGQRSSSGRVAASASYSPGWL